MSDRNINELIYANIQLLCKFHIISIADLEKELSITSGYIEKTKDGTKKLNIEQCYKIAQYFKVTLDELVSNEIQRQQKLAQIAELREQLEKLESEVGEPDDITKPKSRGLKSIFGR